MNIPKIALRNARSGGGRAIVLTLVLVTMLISGVLNLGVCIQRTLVEQAVTGYGDAHVKFVNLTRTQAEFLKNRIEAEYALYVIGLDDFAFIPGREAFPLQLQSETPLAKDLQIPIATGAEPKKMDEVALFPHAAARIGVAPEVGERFTVLVGGAPEDASPMEFVISAVLKPNAQFEAMGLDNLIISEAFANAHYRGTDAYGRDARGVVNNTRQVTLRYRSGVDIAEKSRELAALAGVTDERDVKFNEAYLSATEMSGNTAIVIGGVVLLLMFMGALVAYNHFNMLLIRKVKEYGLLSVIGASRGQIAGLAYLEAMCYAFAALPVGLALGALLTWIAGSRALTGFMPGIDLVIAWSPWAFALAVLVTLVTVAVSVALPAWRAARVAPVEAVRFSGVGEKARRGRHFMEMNLKKLSHINLWRNKGRTLVTILSLTLSGILLLAVSNMAATQLQSVEALVKKSFSGDMLIEMGLFEGDDLLNDAFLAQIKAAPGVEAVTPVDEAMFSSEHTYDDPSIDYIFYDEGVVGLTREMMDKQLKAVDAPGVTTDTLLEPGRVLAYSFEESSFDEWKAKNGGDRVTLVLRTMDETGHFTDTRYELIVVGFIGEDQLLPTGNVYQPYVGTSEMLRAFAPNACTTAVGITVDPARYDEAADALAALVADWPSLSFKTMRQAVSEMRAQVMSVYALLFAIVLVLALVGVMSLINTTLVGVEQRRAELGVLMALGASIAEVRGMLMREGLLVSRICLSFSLPLGLGLGYLMYALQKTLSGAYLTYAWPVWQAALLVALYLIVPALISRRAAARLHRTSAVELICGNPC